MKMDDRKMRILQAIIDDYILTGVPVGSRTISRKYEIYLKTTRKKRVVFICKLHNHIPSITI